jgi:hypothetical protein
MKTMHAWVIGFATVLGAGPLALTHCSSSSSSGTGANSGSTSGSSSGSESSGSGTQSGSGSTGAGTQSGSASGSSGTGSGTASGSSGSTSGSASGSASGTGSGSGSGSEGGSGDDGSASSGSTTTTPSDTPDGGAPSTPGMVTCGSTSCDTSQTSCCHVTTADGGTDTCVGPNGACTGTTNHCDEASDCATGLVCCNAFGGNTCMANCGNFGYQVCRTDDECGTQTDAGAAKQCIVQTCGGQPQGRGPATPVTTVEACASPEFVPPVRGIVSDAGMTWGALPGCTAK